MSSGDSTTVKEEVIESMERSAEVYGLSRSAGRVYGTLYFAPEPLSIPELVEETGYAKSTISNVTRRLNRIGLIHRRSSSGGGRRVQFEPERDFWFVIQDVLRQYVQREINGSQRTLERTLEQVETLEDNDTQRIAQHIEELQTTYDEFERLVELASEHSIDTLIEAIEQYEDSP